MKLGTQLTVTAVGFVVLAVLLISRTGARVGPWEAPNPQEIQWAADPQVAAAVTRIDAKEDVAGDVIEGRLSLLEAAARFRDIEAKSHAVRAPQVFASASSPDEAYCRSVIYFVRGMAPPGERDGDPSARLEAELDARLRDGTLRMPAAGAEKKSDGTAD